MPRCSVSDSYRQHASALCIQANITAWVSDPMMQVQFTPTVEHCSMATLIGLCIRVKLLRALPPRFKVRRNGLISGFLKV